jgi:hypothetical protein
MAASIEELDVLVRSFYEGRGEQVGSSSAVSGFPKPWTPRVEMRNKS